MLLNLPSPILTDCVLDLYEDSIPVMVDDLSVGTAYFRDGVKPLFHVCYPNDHVDIDIAIRNGYDVLLVGRLTPNQFLSLRTPIVVARDELSARQALGL